jgi:hypothetical protein
MAICNICIECRDKILISKYLASVLAIYLRKKNVQIETRQQCEFSKNEQDFTFTNGNKVQKK